MGHYSEDPRFKQLNDVLANFSIGNFDVSMPLSEALDEVDTITAGITMLGEELKATTISRDYFLSIYDSVAEMLFVLDESGTIIDTNVAVEKKLLFRKEDIIGKTFFETTGNPEKLFKNIFFNLWSDNQSIRIETTFRKITDNAHVPVNCSCSAIFDNKKNKSGYLIIASDISERKETEKLILRTIVETQENEQKRVAEDLHDSLGQELSTVQMLISTLKSNKTHQEELLDSCLEILGTSITNLRDICFNLMPSALQNYGLFSALEQLVRRLESHSPLKIKLVADDNISIKNKSLEVVLYRIIQEFINNTIKHACAKNIKIELYHRNNRITLVIQDDGKGFDIDQVSDGNGLSNMESRAKAYNGDFLLFSTPNKGTKFEVNIPLEQ